MPNNPRSSQQPSSPPPQQPRTRKRKRAKTARYLAGFGSFLGAIAAIVTIFHFVGIEPRTFLPIPTSTPSSAYKPIPTPTPIPTYIPTYTHTPTSIHLVTCSAASTDSSIVKFFTQGGDVACFSGIGTIDKIVQPVVRVEVGNTIFATWLYVTLATGISHHSPPESQYNCPGRVAHYEGGNIMRVTQITLVSNSTSCSP